MENTFASFHLNVASNSIWVSQGCTWGIRFLPDTKQKYSQSSLITTLYAKITFQSKGEKVVSSSVLGLITDYHSISAETKKFSLLPLEVTPSLPFVLYHTHLQPIILSPRQLWLGQLLAGILPDPALLFLLHKATSLAWRSNHLASGSKVSIATSTYSTPY